MPTTFNVISLGNFADLDTAEGNNAVENADLLVGQTIGDFGDALAGRIETLSPGSAAWAFNSDGNTYYDQDDPTPERFRINGGPEQEFDSTMVYDATLTYLDGTTADITAVIFQDTAGNVYLAPEFEPNADQTALEAAPLLSITFNGYATNQFLGMAADRQAGSFAVCFAAGTLIETETGPCAVEALAPGDRVLTLDNGAQTVRWIGHFHGPATDGFAPIRIAAGSLGPGMPRRALYVSPQHRILIRSRVAERMFGSAEVLVPAKKLLGLPGITQVTGWDSVDYYHILLDRHEVVWAEGAPAETLLVGAQALRAMSADAKTELAEMFPDLIGAELEPARLIPKGRQQRRLLARHMKNEKPLLERSSRSGRATLARPDHGCLPAHGTEGFSARSFATTG